MTTGIPGLVFALMQDGKPLSWRPLAKDGADLPMTRQLSHAARQPVSIGETTDIELVPERPDEQRQEVRLAGWWNGD